jgi:hypothetical protein
MGRPKGHRDAPDPGMGDQVEVRHACFECGGPLALIAQPACRVCDGVGTLSDAELLIAQTRYNNGRPV